MLQKDQKKPHYLMRVLLAVGLLGFGLYFGNLSVFNVWQSAFPEHAPYLDQLEFRFWAFGILSLLCLGACVWITVKTIRQINKESRAYKRGYP
jgi:hypothetical protein